MIFVKNVRGHRRKEQITNIKINEGLNFFNLNVRTTKSRSKWKNHVQRTEDRRIPKEIIEQTPQN
jgi:hypothetical protein